ncbi:DUF3558 domain-containing protein [Amycolatopsis sp. CA-161197]|uniref:DUF3558 domain-containing protein n=1 Tax=Amycolatopsis sp. CA-161197 TaxID=3239922 RepID=UPI003D90AF47
MGVVAACSGTTGGAVTPKPSTAAPSSSAGPQVPTIANPLPASLIQGDPCMALTPTQVGSLFSGTPTRDPAAKDTGVAKACFWSDVQRGSHVGIQLVYAWKHGLADVYAKKDQGFFKELAPVQGYPVVAYGPSDERPDGRCGVAVGISDDAAFEADAQVATSAVGTGDPCEDARKVADLAVTTLKGDA